MRTTELTLAKALLLGGLTFLLMLPETLPVPVLRALVVERFGVGDRAATWFMAANMVGALLFTPLVGWWIERTGRRRRLAVLLLALDALLMQALAHPVDYVSFLLLRTFEGACHIAALVTVMSLVADAAGERRGRALGGQGAGLTLGVATGAAIGGVLGRSDPLRTLHIASAVLAVAALVAAWLLPADRAPTARPGFRELWSAVRAQPRLGTPVLVAFAERFTVGFFTTGFPLLLTSVYELARPQVGMLLAAFLYPFALLSYPFGKLAESRSRRTLVALGSLAYGSCVMLVGVTPPGLMWVLMPLCGVGSAVMFVPSLLWLLDEAPGLGRATAIAVFHAAGSFGFLLGPLVCGELLAFGGTADGDRTGYVLAFAVAGLVQIGAGLCVLIRRAARDAQP
ncbi:MAG: MFS transporter [Planctomycetota bacterium]|jgi:MFS family permease